MHTKSEMQALVKFIKYDKIILYSYQTENHKEKELNTDARCIHFNKWRRREEKNF